MRKFSWLLFLLVLSKTNSLSAQESSIYTSKLKEFDRAVSLYKDNQYASAQYLFERVKATTQNEETRSDCTYYDASCAVRLGHANADVLMEAFLETYPTSSKSNQAYTEVAHYYFNQGNYKEALRWFEKTDESQLSVKDKDRFNFQKGYSLFNSNDKKEASKYFNKVLNSETYGAQAKYYMGFMAYEGDNYQEANKYFDQVATDEKYAEKLSYYQADMSFKSGNFEKAIEQGQKAMAKSTPAEKSELNKIIGESYFNLKKYNEAIPYLVAYKGKRGKWNNTDYYQLGYAYYKQNDYENAIAQFNKIIGGKDGVAQNAYYHLGESYLKLNQKQQALNAFKNASEMVFDAAIQEDAYLNYAKLSYELGNSYQSVPSVLLGFINKYPNNPNRSVVEKLLIDSYISSKNYKEALTLLEKNKSPENRLAYQKVTFYRGLELYTDRDYDTALQMFQKSLANTSDVQFTARATFWKGETEYVLNDYNKSLLSFKQFVGMATAASTPEFKNSSYNVAYAYFKLKEYDAAGDAFQKFIDKVKDDKIRITDAYLRLADCRFVTSKYWPAMDAYNKVIELKSVDADYAYYQKALCYGFVSRNDRKIEDLNAFIQNYPKSPYRDDALFELANTYVAANKQDSALKTYDKLIAEYKNGAFTSRAILRQGLVYYNSDRSSEALLKFKKSSC